MKLIDRHLLREYLVPFAYCLCGFCMLYMVAGMFDKASDFLRAGTSLQNVLRYYAHFLVAYSDQSNVSFVVYVLPVSLLAGAMYSLSRLTRQNELTAMLASGVSLYRMTVPFIGVGVVCSIAASGIQEFVAPKASRQIADFNVRLKEKNGTTESARDQRFNFKFYNRGARRRWSIGQLSLRNPARMTGVTVAAERADRSYEWKISAERTEWRDGAWWFYGVIEQKHGLDGQPQGPATGPEPGPRQMTALSETPQDLISDILENDIEKYASSLEVLRLVRRRSKEMTANLGAGEAPDPREVKGWIKKKVDAHNRLAMPWACLVASLLAIPAGTRGGRRGVLAGIMFAVALFFAFYLMNQAAMFLGKTQVLRPWLSAWLANMVFFVVGLAMIARMKT